jgi:hypothetical protein
MRQLTPVEMLSLAKLLEMETNGLKVAQASLMAITDEQLKSMTQAGLAATQSRVAGLQQFIMENNIVSVSGVNTAQSQTQTRQEGY